MAEVLEEDLRWRLREPDDLHVHFRDFSAGAWQYRLKRDDIGPPELFGGDPHNRLPVIFRYTARQFRRAVAMPNTDNPIVNAAMAMGYRERIRFQAEADGCPAFEPLMTIYVTHATTPDMIFEARAAGIVGGKFYPAHGTTGSGKGVHDFLAPEMFAVYGAMQESGMLALFHLASPDPNVDIFDREAVMVPVFRQIRERFPLLKMVFEHISTAAGVACVRECGERTYATVTPQHMLKTRTDLLGRKGLMPSLFCMPPLQTEEDRRAVVEAAIFWDNVFAGTDSAPHFDEQKYCECGAMGCFNATHALEHYAVAFEADGGPDWIARFEAFTSERGARAYGLPLNEGTMLLSRASVEVPRFIRGQESGRRIAPLNHGERVPFTAHRERM